MKNKLFDIWKQDKASINSWLSIPNSFTAEAFGKMGWDSVTVDMQHGQNDYSSSIAMIQGLTNSDTVPYDKSSMERTWYYYENVRFRCSRNYCAND